VAIPLFSFAQQQATGVVKEQKSNVPISGVMVHNPKNGAIYYTDANGNYQIAASAGDTLSFESTGYFPYKYAIPLGSSLTDKVIRLSPNVEVIDSVIVRRALTKYQQDSLARYQIYDSALNKKTRRTNIDQDKYGARTNFGLNINGPISSLLTRRSKKYKQLKRFQNGYAGKEDELFIEYKYNKGIVSELTGMQDEEAGNFINKYPMELAFARTGTELEIKMWILYNYRTWKNLSPSEKQPDID